MEPVSQGMAVWSLDDRRLGVVSAVNECCFRFDVHKTTRRISVTSDGIFNVACGRISLVYIAGDAHRYGCGRHPAGGAVSLPPVRIGETVSLPSVAAEVRPAAIPASAVPVLA